MPSIHAWTRRLACVLLAAVVAPNLTSCASTQVEPPDIEAYADMIYDATSELLAKEIAELGPDGGADELSIAVLPIAYKGSLDGGSNDAELYGAISSAVTDSRLYVPVNRDVVRVACDEARVGDSRRLFLEDVRTGFLDSLHAQSVDPEYFILPELTTLETLKKGVVMKRKATIRLALVHSKEGVETQQSSGATVQEPE